MTFINPFDALLDDLAQTNPKNAFKGSPEDALTALKLLTIAQQDPQDFGYDAQKWEEWLFVHFPVFKQWREFEEARIKRRDSRP
jgi:hypothetical protein